MQLHDRELENTINEVNSIAINPESMVDMRRKLHLKFLQQNYQKKLNNLKEKYNTKKNDLKKTYKEKRENLKKKYEGKKTPLKIKYEEMKQRVDEKNKICEEKEKRLEQMKLRKVFSDDECCSICREQILDGEGSRVWECGHCFHKDCIMNWIQYHKTCPDCRHKICNEGLIKY